MAELPKINEQTHHNGSDALQQAPTMLNDEQVASEAAGQEIAVRPRGRRRQVNIETDSQPGPPRSSAESQQQKASEPQPVAVRAQQQSATAAESEEVEIVLDNIEGHVRERLADDLSRVALGLIQLVRENLERLDSAPAKRAAELLDNVGDDIVSPDFWRGLGSVLRYQVEEQLDFFRRRQRGTYTTDPYGYDPELLAMVEPLARFFYRTWWRVSVEGIEHIPEKGRALLVANHSGVLPFDGMMIVTAVLEGHGQRRLVRSLFNDWFVSVPFVAPLLTGLGQVQARPENALRLLEEDELVCTFPEGYKGISKPFKNRYKLTRFGRGGYVRSALQTGAPLIPVAVVGAEEIYPLLVNAQPVAQLLGMPYFPITPFFPWLGPLGTIPLPSKWWIAFGAPIETASYGPAAADDPLTVAQLSDQVRDTVQAMIDARLAKRKSVFFD